MNARRRMQAGFSLVELLVAAFVLAIGILGLTMLQLMAIRTNTSSASTSKALEIANRTLESVAVEGHRSMLWKTEGRTGVPTLGTSYTYLGKTSVTKYITNSGLVCADEATAKASKENYFKVDTTSADTLTAFQTISSASPTTLGRSSVFTVVVTFTDQIVTKNGAITPVSRIVRLARRIAHA